MLGSNFFADDGSSAWDQTFPLKSVESAITGLSSQMGTILALLQQQTPVSPWV